MDKYYLSEGSHATPAEGRCAMEWVAYLAGEPHTDEPACVSRVVRDFCMSLNDNLPPTDRQKLRPYLARTIGTRHDGHDGARLARLDRFVRDHGGDPTPICDCDWCQSDVERERLVMRAAFLAVASPIQATLDLLNDLLPTEVIELPVVEDWQAICQVA